MTVVSATVPLDNEADNAVDLLDSDAGRTMTCAHSSRSCGELSPLPHVRRFALRDGLVLFDASSNALFAYNQIASRVWELIEAGHNEMEIAASLAGTWRIPVDRARQDVNSVIALWRRQRLLPGASDRPASSAPDLTVPEQVPTGGQSQWVCTIRGIPIAFSIPIDRARGLRALFSHLETPDAIPQSSMTISMQPSGALVFTEDGRERLRARDWAVAVGALFVAILERIRPGVTWFALIHGAALARRDHGFALAGASGSGKSTLTAGLIGAGFDYLADDCVTLSAPDARIIPWPLPVSVKAGAFDVLLPGFPELMDTPRYLSKGGEARLLIPPRDAWDAQPVPLRTILFPTFQDGVAPQYRRLSSFEALERLLNDRIWLGDPITEDRVESFLAWLNETPAYALVYSEQADAIRMVQNLIP